MLKSCFQKELLEAGCDEAGRGCIAGPVFAAAVILPKNYRNERINDSKLVPVKERNKLRKEIEKKALAWAVAAIASETIDKINILAASFKAMHKALDMLDLRPEFLLIDGNRFIPYSDIPHECIIKGDGKYLSIAAASILAKTHRDEFMQKLHKTHPEYHWDQNKGYPTEFHRSIVQEKGPTNFHRKTFHLYPAYVHPTLF